LTLLPHPKIPVLETKTVRREPEHTDAKKRHWVTVLNNDSPIFDRCSIARGYRLTEQTFSTVLSREGSADILAYTLPPGLCGTKGQSPKIDVLGVKCDDSLDVSRGPCSLPFVTPPAGCREGVQGSLCSQCIPGPRF
jgi:hypothetical protein